MIVAGGGVTASGAQKEVVELAEMLSIPVATSLNAKGAIAEDHPLAVGVCGSYSRWCANRVVSEADLVLFIGSHTGSQVTLDWKIPAVGTTVVQIDIDPSELGRSYPAQVALQGDAQATVRRLSKLRSQWADTPAGSSGLNGWSGSGAKRWHPWPTLTPSPFARNVFAPN